MLSCNGAFNAGAVSKRLGVSGYTRFGRDRSACGATSRWRSARARRSISRTSRRAESLELIRAARAHGAQRHLRGDAASFHARRKRGAALGPEREDESAAAHRRRRRGDSRGDRRRHYRHDRDRSRAARSAAPSGWTARRRCSARRRDADASCTEGDARGVLRTPPTASSDSKPSLGLALELVHRSVDQPARLVEMMSLNPARVAAAGGGHAGRGRGARTSR